MNSRQASSLLPSNRGRSLFVHTLVQKLGLLNTTASNTHRPLQVIKPRPATTTELCLYHDKDFIDFVLDPSQHSSTAESGPALEETRAEFGIEDVIVCLHGGLLS